MVAVPVKVLVSVGRFPVGCNGNVLSGPGETKMYRNGKDPSEYGVSAVNCMRVSVELMCCRNW